MNAWEMKKLLAWFEKRNRFSQEEQRTLNLDAYDLAAAHVFEAAAELYGMGEKRYNDAGETLSRVGFLELHTQSEKFSMFNHIAHYSKQQAQQMTQGAYKLGVEHALTAIEYSYRLGDTRLARIKAKTKEFQQADLGPGNRSKSIYEARLMRDKRRAARPTKKGAVLDEF